MQNVSVVIPVGPEGRHREFLADAVDSVRRQTYQVDEILLIDDMHGLDRRWGFLSDCNVWYAPWRLGVMQAFNAGVALAKNDLVFMLGADDLLKPTCIAQCIGAYYQNDGNKDAYYWVGVEYSDERDDQYLPCNAAMVTKGLWRDTGGFPIESASGACDAAFISTLMVHAPDRLICVNRDKTLYWYRVGEHSATADSAPWQGVILETRNLCTQLWKPPEWGRYEL